MNEWNNQIQKIVNIVDVAIRENDDEKLALGRLAAELGYSEYYVSRMFTSFAGMSLREYLRLRRLAFALQQLRDTDNCVLDIAVDFGYSSAEAFCRAFRRLYGVTPTEYRRDPKPVVLRTIVTPFDCFLSENDSVKNDCAGSDVKTYFVTVPVHKFLHIRNYESVGYWDFRARQNKIVGQDFNTICGLLGNVKGKIDDVGGERADASSGQIMAWINEPTGRICSWGIPLAECYGVRLHADWSGTVPPHMMLSDIAEGEYVVFEHGPFDYATEGREVEAKTEKAMKNFDYAASGYKLDVTQGRVFYFFMDEKRFWKYIRPVVKV